MGSSPSSLSALWVPKPGHGVPVPVEGQCQASSVSHQPSPPPPEQPPPCQSSSPKRNHPGTVGTFLGDRLGTLQGPAMG